MPERISISWNTLSSRSASRPATAMTSIRASQPAIHSAAIGLEGVRSIGEAESRAGRPVCSSQACLCNGQICRWQHCAGLNFAVGSWA